MFHIILLYRVAHPWISIHGSQCRLPQLVYTSQDLVLLNNEVDKDLVCGAILDISLSAQIFRTNRINWLGSVNCNSRAN